MSLSYSSIIPMSRIGIGVSVNRKSLSILLFYEEMRKITTTSRWRRVQPCLQRRRRHGRSSLPTTRPPYSVFYTSSSWFYLYSSLMTFSRWLPFSQTGTNRSWHIPNIKDRRTNRIPKGRIQFTEIRKKI